MEQDKQWVLFNDQIIDRHEALINIEDRGYQFGDGIYEVIRVYDGHVFTMEEHLHRLERSAQEIDLSLPYSICELSSKLARLMEQANLQEGIIYVQVSRGVAPRHHGFPSPAADPQLVAYTKDMNRPDTYQEKGATAILTEDIRWLRCDIKSINLLGNVLAKEKATKHHAYEAIQHRDGIITEGSSTNVFMVQDGILYTHPATNLILNGITRQKVLELCQRLNLSVQETSFTTAQLLSADEVFITSTTNEVLPIVQIDEQEIGPGIVGPMTVKIQEAFDEEIKACAMS